MNNSRRQRRELYDRWMVAVSAFVLVGGRSSRMGSDKALLELGGKALIVRAIELARKVTTEVRVVGDPEKYERYARVVEDVFHGRGPLGGIHAALRASNSELNLMLAVDLPFIETRFLEFLIAQAAVPGAMVTVPSTEDYFQPLCAVYRKEFAAVAERALAEGRNKIDALFREVSLRKVSEDELRTNGFSSSMFRNLNTEEDWRNAKIEFE